MLESYDTYTVDPYQSNVLYKQKYSRIKMFKRINIVYIPYCRKKQQQ